MDYYQYSKDKIKLGKNILEDQMKIYCHKQNDKIFDHIDFNHNTLYNHPVLVSHFFKSHKTKNIVDILSLLCGFMNDQIEPSPSNFYVKFDNEGIGYIPNIGYFILPEEQHEKLNIVFEKEKMFLLRNRHQVKFGFYPITYIKDTNIELFQAVPSLLSNLFDDIDGDDRNKISHEFISILNKKNKATIERAFKIIKDLAPKYYEQITQVAYGILLFRSKNLVSFTTRTSPGIAYINVQEGDELIFFITELVHQFGHNIFYKLIHSGKKLFKIKQNTVLPELTNGKRSRTIYGAFHGLFTTNKVAEILEILLNNKTLFSEKEQIEILGRFVDNYRRFRTGLEKLKLNEIFTKEGIELYNILDNECYNIYKRNEHLISLYSSKNQQFVYSHDCFLTENNYFSNY